MHDRRSFLRSSLALVAAGACPTLAHVVQGSPELEVRVAEGLLRGSVDENGIRVFRGVPFARPPVGPLRFRPPQPPLAWTDVRPATHFAAASVQPNEPDLPQSEDCLYLNLWAPPPAAQSAPVFVWIHGGGFTGGRSFDPLQNGARFANSGIVCITIAYRLGALGFLDVSPLLGSEYEGSADNALRDVIAALTWINRNVHAFGGDPHRVTIGGESAGAKLTDMLAGIPSAAPLFHQMISESGGAERIWPARQGQEVGIGFGKTWSGVGARTMRTLLSAPATEIVEAQTAFTAGWPAHFPLRAEYTPGLIPGSPLAAIEGGSTRGKRLLLGTNRDESALFVGPHPKNDPQAKDLGNMTVAQFDSVAARYAQLYPDMPEPLRRIRSLTAEEYWVPSVRVADAHLAGGGEAFVYRLDLPGTGRFTGLAFHSYDLRFVWEFFGDQVPSAPSQALAQQMHGAWVQFIHGHTPAAPGLPEWPHYSLPSRPTMILDIPSRVELNPSGAELALWNGLLTT